MNSDPHPWYTVTMDTAKANEIGYVYASIAGDRRYTSSIKVTIFGKNNEFANVTLYETSAEGGMDSLGGSTRPREVSTTVCAADPRAIVPAIRRAQDNVIKKYGKITKNFVWHGVSEHGLSVARCAEAIKALASR